LRRLVCAGREEDIRSAPLDLLGDHLTCHCPLWLDQHGMFCRS